MRGGSCDTGAYRSVQIGVPGSSQYRRAMTYQRLAYDDQDTALKMHLDCAACATQMGLLEHISPQVAERAPSIEYDDFPREIRKPDLTVTEATALLAAQLHLHMD